MKIVRLSPEKYTEWSSFLSEHPDATFFHTIKWMEILNEYGFGEPLYFLLYESDDLLGILPFYFVDVFPFGKGLISPSDCNGPLMRNDEVCEDCFPRMLQLVEDVVKERRIAFLKLRLQSDSFLNSLMPKYYVKCREYCTFILDLSQGIERIFRDKLHKKTRNAIRKAIKLGVEVETKLPKLETYWMLYKETMIRTKGVLDENRIKLFKLVWSRLKFQEDFITLTAIFEGKPVAGIMAFLFQDKVHVWYNASLSRFLYLNLNQLLYWRLIEKATDMGYRYLDFGPTPLDPSEGHYQFKARFGGTMIVFNDYAYFASKMRYFLIEGSTLKLAKRLNIRKKLPQIVLRKIGKRIIF